LGIKNIIFQLRGIKILLTSQGGRRGFHWIRHHGNLFFAVLNPCLKDKTAIYHIIMKGQIHNPVTADFVSAFESKE